MSIKHTNECMEFKFPNERLVLIKIFFRRRKSLALQTMVYKEQMSFPPLKDVYIRESVYF